MTGISWSRFSGSIPDPKLSTSTKKEAGIDAASSDDTHNRAVAERRNVLSAVESQNVCL